MAKEKTVPLSLRLSKELTGRLVQSAARLKVKKHTLAQDAIEAAVKAIEKNSYRIVIPIQFDVTHVAAPKEATAGEPPDPPEETPPAPIAPEPPPAPPRVGTPSNSGTPGGKKRNVAGNNLRRKLKDKQTPDSK